MRSLRAHGPDAARRLFERVGREVGMNNPVSASRVRRVLDRLDAAAGALAEAREICDEIGRGAEEERHDCAMAMGIIDEVAAVLEPLTAEFLTAEPSTAETSPGEPSATTDTSATGEEDD